MSLMQALLIDGHLAKVLTQVTQARYLCHFRVSYNMSRHREHIGRSLGVEICWNMEIKIDETYHVASCCCP